MKRYVLSALAVTGLIVGTALAADTESGLKIGDPVGAFNVKDVTGPNAGKSLCYRCQYGNRPVVAVFARELTPEVASLVKQIDATVAKNEGKDMKAFVVLLSEDADKVAPKLSECAKKNEIKQVPLTIFDGEVGPPDYKISKDAEVTVLMWNKSAVAVNQGFAKGKLDEAAVKKVVAETKKILN